MATVRVTIEVVVALVLTYFICTWFHLPLFTGGKDGLFGDGPFIAIVLVLIPEGIRLALRGEFSKKKDDDFTNLR